MGRPTVETIKELVAASGNRCMFPGCDHPLVKDTGAVVSHVWYIREQDPSGRRYEWDLTDEHANHPENLILICSEHHAEIDFDPETYTAERLGEMKAAHESAHQGGPEPDDAVAQFFISRLEEMRRAAKVRIGYGLWHLLHARVYPIARTAWFILVVALCLLGPRAPTATQWILCPICVALAGGLGYALAGWIGRRWERLWSWSPESRQSLKVWLAGGSVALVVLCWWAAYDPRPPWTAESCYERAVAHMDNGQYDAAIRELKKAVEADPKFVDAHVNMGFAYCKLGQYAEALAACRKAVAIRSDCALAYVNMAWAYGGLGRHAEALAACRKAIAINPDLAVAYANMGSAYNSLGQYAEALAASKKAVAIRPNYADAHVNIGFACNSLGQYAEALAAGRKAIAIKPDCAEAHVNMGAAHNGLGQYAKGLAACKKAIAIKPDCAEAYFTMGFAYGGLGRDAEALAASRKAVAIRPNYADAHVNIGFFCNRLGHYAEALAACKKAIAIKPDCAEAYANMGFAHGGLEHYAEAVAACRKAVAIKSDYADAYYFIALGCEGMEKFAEALKAYERYLERAPAGTYAERARQRVSALRK